MVGWPNDVRVDYLLLKLMKSTNSTVAYIKRAEFKLWVIKNYMLI